MAAGNRPFLGESLATIFSRILSQRPLGIADSGFRSQSANVSGGEFPGRIDIGGSKFSVQEAFHHDGEKS
jgi:hypothetical protein